MAEWPTLEELKQVLDVTSDEWDGEDDESRLEAVRLSAIAHVKAEIGVWDEDVDEPTVPQNRAALRMAELMAQNPSAAPDSLKDPVYQEHMYGSRLRFGIG